MKATLTNCNRIYRLELENGSSYRSEPGETHADFVLRVKRDVFSSHGVWLEAEDMDDFTDFSDARNEALSKIEFIDFELNRMDREDGRKSIHKAALKKIINIIDLYNSGEWKAIAGMEIQHIK